MAARHAAARKLALDLRQEFFGQPLVRLIVVFAGMAVASLSNVAQEFGNARIGIVAQRKLHGFRTLYHSGSHGMFFMPWVRSEFVPARAGQYVVEVLRSTR